MEFGSTLDMRKFVVPECVFGVDARRLAANYAVNLGARKVLVVTDPGVVAAGWPRDVTTDLENAELPYTVFDEVTSNPHAEQVTAGAERYLTERCNCIIAVGGGSPIDCAKGIGIVSSNGGNILDYEGVDEVRISIPPLICVPTTGGSSADVSQFAIISDTERQVKTAIISKTIVPDVSLVDPITLTSMPAALTADTGIDTVTHSFEAYISNAHSDLTDQLALEALRLMVEYLPAAITDPANVAIRHRTAVACLNAGFAFSNAGLGLVHALTHSLGGLLGTAHGMFNAVLLPYVVSYNFPVVSERYRTIGEAMGLEMAERSPEEAESALLEKINQLKRSLSLCGTLSDLGIERSDIPSLAVKAINDPDIATNPREPTISDIEDIYERAL